MWTLRVAMALLMSSSHVRSLSSILTTRSECRLGSSSLTTSPLRYSYSTSSRWRLYSSSSSSSEADSSTDNIKKRIVFLGTPDVAATSLHAIHQASLHADSMFQVTAVVTQPPKRRRRKGQPEPSPVGLAAEQLGIYTLCPEKANDPAFLDELAQQIQPDLCITAAYGNYLPKRFLATPKYGTVNIHPSLLPRWRGASPVQRSLQAGDHPLGVSVLFTVSKMDAGPIIAQATHDVDKDATATTVLPELFDIGTQLLLDALPDILCGNITMDTCQPQDESGVVNADMIDSAEAELQVWRESARACHNRLRGFSMWPGVFLYVQIGEREEVIKLKVTKSRVVVDSEPQEPTNIIRLGPNKGDGLYVVCGDGSVLELLEVQPATKRAFPAKDFQNGYPGEVIRWIQPEPSLPQQEQELSS